MKTFFFSLVIYFAILAFFCYSNNRLQRERNEARQEAFEAWQQVQELRATLFQLRPPEEGIKDILFRTL